MRSLEINRGFNFLNPITLDDNEEAKWVGTFIDLPKEYEELKFKYFTIGVYVARVHFKFHV